MVLKELSDVGATVGAQKSYKIFSFRGHNMMLSPLSGAACSRRFSTSHNKKTRYNRATRSIRHAACQHGNAT